MDTNDLINRIVTLRSSLGEVDRRVVADLGDTILVCRPEEYERALAERREPIAIGIRKADVVKIVC